MKKNIIIYTSIITFTLILGVVVFFAFNLNGRNKNVKIYINSFDRQERLVLYDGSNIPYLKNCDDFALNPVTSFNPGDKDDFINNYVLTNEYYNGKYSFQYGSENQFHGEVYEFFYKGYAFYLFEQTDQTYSYMFYLEPGYISGGSKGVGLFEAIGPYHLLSELRNISNKDAVTIDYSKIYTNVSNHMDLVAWYYSINSNFVSIDEATWDIKIKVVNFQTGKLIEGAYILISADGSVILKTE